MGALCREWNEPVRNSFLVAPGSSIRIVSLVGSVEVRVIQHGDNRCCTHRRGCVRHPFEPPSRTQGAEGWPSNGHSGRGTPFYRFPGNTRPLHFSCSTTVPTRRVCNHPLSSRAATCPNQPWRPCPWLVAEHFGLSVLSDLEPWNDIYMRKYRVVPSESHDNQPIGSRDLSPSE